MFRPKCNSNLRGGEVGNGGGINGVVGRRDGGRRRKELEVKGWVRGGGWVRLNLSFPETDS